MNELLKLFVKTRTHTVFIIAAIVCVSSSLFMHMIEPETFPTLFISFWWVMTTVTTVGYGDYAPVTTFGRVFALFLYLFGIGLIGLVIGKIVNSFSSYQKLKEAGRLSYKGRDHIVIIGWSPRAKKTIEELLIFKKESDIILIDKLPKTPYEIERVRYIQGDATSFDTLARANVKEAFSVCIFATNSNKDSIEIDGKTLLIASAIENYANEINKEIYTIVEIVNEKHIPNFKHVSVDEFVLSNEAFSDLMAKSAIHKGSTKLFMQLLNRSHDDDIWEVRRKDSWKTYNDAFEALKNLGANLVSDHRDFGIVRRLHDTIPPNAKLFVICDEGTYKKIEEIL